jgi:tetratricopeptide (TPR) repeat protein
VIQSLNNLATLYAEQGRYSEAEPPLTEALTLSEQGLGKSHPLAIATMNNVAELYHFQGSYQEAELVF